MDDSSDVFETPSDGMPNAYLVPGAGTRVEGAVVETDLSGFQQASLEQAEQVIGNTSIRIRLRTPDR